MNLRARIGLLVQAQGARRAAREVDTVGRSTKRLGVESEVAGRRMKRANREAVYFRRSIHGLGTVVGVGAVGLAGLGAVLHNSVEEYREAWKTGRATNTVIESTGGAANVTAPHVSDLAESLSTVAGMDDELIQKGENLLLTFKNVRNELGAGNDIFDQTTRLAVDMSAAFTAAGKSMDVSSAALMLGKALNDPAKGLARLTRAGVSFDAQQIKQIKTMQKHGDMLGAQRIILDEVASEFGGQAAALADPVDQLDTSWKNLEETIGTALAPTLKDVATDLSKFLTEMREGKGTGGDFRDVLEGVWGALKQVWSIAVDLAPAILAVTAAIVAYKAAMILAAGATGLLVGIDLAKWLITAARAEGIMTAAQFALNLMMDTNPVLLLVGAIAALIAILIKYKEVRDAILPGGFPEAINEKIGAKALEVSTGFFSGFPGMADGGTVTSGGIGLVGESGPELLDLPTGARVTPLQAHAPVSLAQHGRGREFKLEIPVYLDGKKVGTGVRRVALADLLATSPA